MNKIVNATGSKDILKQLAIELTPVDNPGVQALYNAGKEIRQAKESLRLAVWNGWNLARFRRAQQSPADLGLDNDKKMI